MLIADILARITATQTGSNDFGGPEFEPKIEKLIALTNGTAPNQADILWADQRTVASGATDAIDLAGVLADAFGATITAAELVAVIVVNQAKDGTANTTALTIGGGTNPVIANALPTLQPGGVVLLAAGHASGLGAVTAGTADTLNVVNASGAAATYQILILARSA
ncbi:hypothetical protein [Sinorhizobium meliloti]|uniref:hypothetical protein n=1 Tax=Rhizobium meliloti TaxID=382 RepID=UPI000FD56095|nr:hypothetical protein [Sinorhizobium meliloti]MDW9440973.1 hypothetical protein [Sinorhizobium meliloti]MDW9818176.1 hypothetical protein [Sinorhizobium meliloti]MDX0262377.1 hypothetical protein [Sinorhizobium meliloti]MDX0351796.1 hypothetical protein [Sinorhizobium meliloti]RVI22983.1 hypothetical protein CN207_26955 [Sinorhizobium meliloti]